MLNVDTSRSRGGRPKGIVRLSRVVTGCYVKKMELVELYNFWKKHQPAKAARVDEITQQYSRALGWDSLHPRYAAVRDLAIRTLTRELLLMKIIDMGFTRVRKDAVTGGFVTFRACDQLKTLQQIDDEVEKCLLALGLVPRALDRKNQGRCHGAKQRKKSEGGINE